MRCGLYFVELRVRDVDAAARWYRDVLGLNLLLEDGTDGFVLLEAGPARVALKEGEPTPGGVLLAFEVENLPGWVERLRVQGIEPEGPIRVSPEGYRRLRLRDPDGYAVSLFEWQ